MSTRNIMRKKQRIKELERRVAELEARLQPAKALVRNTETGKLVEDRML